MVLVTGATGNVGAQVVQELRGRGVGVRAFVRDLARAAAILGDDIDLAYGDFADVGTLRQALDGVERVFLVCPNDPLQVEYAANAIDAAALAGVRQIVVMSTVGAEAGSQTVFFDQHGRIEEHAQDSGVPTVVLRSSHLMSNIRASADSIKQAGRFFLPAGDARIAMIDPRDVAAVATLVMETSDHDGRTYLLTGPEAITYGEVAEHLSHALDRPITYVAVTDEAALNGLAQAGLPQWLAEQIVAAFGALRAGVNAYTTDWVRELTGREPRGIDDFARWIAPLLSGS
ncbi:SDR family oxidoreductase [Streptomyces sp. Ru71]|uniref:SDR family oxidoreductase n=1 Tax=Streptomyces sp. Ru71 TaxID=2080746 RepID=UPI0021564C86|nr:SDR family oxidoreductase [Streptomyces sp. Ru71]